MGVKRSVGAAAPTRLPQGAWLLSHIAGAPTESPVLHCRKKGGALTGIKTFFLLLFSHGFSLQGFMGEVKAGDVPVGVQKGF